MLLSYFYELTIEGKAILFASHCHVLLQKLNFWYNGLHHLSSFPEIKKQRYNVFSQRDNLEF